MNIRQRGLTSFLLIGASLWLCIDRSSAQAAEPSVVKVVKSGERIELTRDGRPYRIQGAGGDTHLEELARAGGNSIRTWGADDKLGALLDRAQALGLTVTVGIWLGHERHGFDYNDPARVGEQLESARKVILRHRDHPAVLMWALGNEMEGEGGNAAIWSAINNLAHLAKTLDPNHPTMTVIAELGGEKIKNLHRLCPDIDVVGINSYGGALTVAARYKAAGGVKPFVLTEYGPPGAWESPRTSWGAPREQTSTEKAVIYRDIFKSTIAPGIPCLGSYAFLWGTKREATATWFGLFLEGGARLGGVDALTEVWTGKPVSDACPSVGAIRIEGSDQVDAGTLVRASIVAGDPEGGVIRTRWGLEREGVAGVGGDAEATPPSFPEAIVRSDANSVEVRVPGVGGGYRLYAVVTDPAGHAATANVPLFVRGPAAPLAKGRATTLPAVIYDEAGRTGQAFAPSGFMGNTRAIKLDEGCPEQPHTGSNCLRVDFSATSGWGGVAWQSPSGDWGDRPGGLDLHEARRLTFWARGARGGEVINFGFGILGADKKFPDTASGQLEKVALETDWHAYSINLEGKDLSRIKTAFMWSTASSGQPITFYLDDIRFE